MVRTDQTARHALTKAKAWRSPHRPWEARLRIWRELPDGKEVVYSWSGHERNHLFMNHGGERFDDVSLVSGLDNVADGRGFAIWDFDRDGWSDIALVNANRPQLNLYRNQIGQYGDSRNHGVIAVRLVGGNRDASASDQWSNRDGYGAMVTVTAGDMRLKRELRCGEGFAAQNSATLLFGIAERSVAQRVHVRWPSGKQQDVESVPAGTLLVVIENPAESDNGCQTIQTPYLKNVWNDRHEAEPENDDSERLAIAAEVLDPGDPSPPGIHLFTTTATWCAACKKHLPQLRLLREHFSAGQLGLWGVAVDPADTAEMLRSYRQDYAPAYKLLSGPSQADLDQLARVFQRRTVREALPATVMTDNRGNVLEVLSGVPTVSKVASLFQE